METFRQLAEQFRHLHVTLVHPTVTGSGILALHGADTKLSIATSGELTHEPHENGWFDLRLAGDKGELIYLHNALCLRTRFPNPCETTHRYEIYPNIVVVGADALTQDGLVESISFTSHKLRPFFRYEVVEWQTLSDAPVETLESLKRLRYQQKDYEFFDPQTVFLIHHLPKPISFKIQDRSYSVSVSGTASFGWSDANIKARPRPTIAFAQPVTISAALDYILEWRRFFTQLAMEPVPFDLIQVGRSEVEESQEAYIYIPEFDNGSTNDWLPFGPGGGFPFNAWAEREKLGALMAGWLRKQPERYQFRDKLDHVIRVMHERTETNHIMVLAAGLESLVELDRTSPYDSGHIELLVNGACAAAKEAGINIKPERLRGLLSLLRKENLGKRLLSLQEATSSWMPPYDGKKFNRTVQGVRNQTAHGTGGAMSSIQQLARTIQAFAALGALWDLTSSGLDVNATNRWIRPLSMAALALTESFPPS